jgi:hypothetical protein
MEFPADRIASMTAPEVNKAIEMINRCFKSLLEHKDNPGPWLELESKTSFYCNCQPFAASYLLATSLDQATCTQPNLKEWKDNYQQCVLSLKKHNLERYNEKEFHFSEKSQFMLKELESLAQNPFMRELTKQMITMLDQNPQRIDKIKKAMKSSDPFVMLAAMFENPQPAEMMPDVD